MSQEVPPAAAPRGIADGLKQSFWLIPIDLVALGFARLLIALMSVLPERPGLALARGTLHAGRWFMPRERSVGMRNLQLIFPEKTQEERSAILQKSYEVLARNLYGFSQIPKLSKARAAQVIDHRAGKVIIDRIRESGAKTGVLLPTLHFGAFEMLVQLQSLNDRPFAFLARGFGFARLDRWWNKRREIFGSVVFDRKGGYQEIVRHLRAGFDVGVLFDQNVKRNHALFVDFFGIPAATTKSIAVAALRTKCPIIFAACIDNFDGTYELVAEEVRNPADDPGTTEEKMLALTRDLHERVERLIRRRPEQWFWIHRRYKTRPPGEPEDIYG